MSIIPYVRHNPCAEPYRQLAASPPLQGTSDGGEGFPWRILYGYCVAQSGRMSLHQDWVVSYLDATPQGDAPGGDGVSFGTDFSVQWRHKRGASVTPYYELGGGVQYAAGTPFPAHGSRWTFTTNVGAGLLILLRPNLRLNTAIRYLHISNAGLFSENAGYDAFHMVVGLRW
ncbi:MAG: acyloxyacyl hydrolase [Gammaproteobacteria bacterium]|nr:acyloxyacyl hydrolase [Gammaproteobacteria bacterium]